MSSELVDITEELAHRRALEIFARLLKLSERRSAEIRANPDLFLKAAYALMGAYERRLDELRSVLTPAVTRFGVLSEFSDPTVEMYRQLRAIRELLEKPISS